MFYSMVKYLVFWRLSQDIAKKLKALVLLTYSMHQIQMHHKISQAFYTRVYVVTKLPINS